jgi:hypothetical protein
MKKNNDESGGNKFMDLKEGNLMIFPKKAKPLTKLETLKIDLIVFLKKHSVEWSIEIENGKLFFKILTSDAL